MLTGANLIAQVSYITNIPHTEFKLYANGRYIEKTDIIGNLTLYEYNSVDMKF